MRVTTTTLDRLADAAVSARDGANLWAFASSDRIPETAFAKNGDGSVTLTGIDMLKEGTFNGLSLLASDLESMAQRFVDLRDSGVFLPPFRLDHSWSILSVIGWHENVETYRKVDTTDSLEKTFLRADVRITGSMDYTPAQIVDAIKRGALRSRSSELGYYVTNSGVELPLVFYGSAFVDIPAVEGLAPVELSRTRLSTPHKLTTLTATHGDDMTDETTPDETAETPDVTPESGDPAAVETDAAVVTPDEETDETVETPDEEPSGEVEETVETGAGVPTQPDASEGEGGNADAAGDGTAAELAAARAEIAQLRSDAANREIARFRTAGVIVAANEEAATALLTHSDPEVRRSAGTLLGHVPAAVTLGRKQGRTSLSSEGTGGERTTSGIVLGMPKDEAGDLWSSLSSEDRKRFSSEWSAYLADRQANGVTD